MIIVKSSFFLYNHPNNILHGKVKIMEEKTCEGDHSNHVCQLIVNRNKDLDKIKDIVKNPKYICFNCARVAESNENLCAPMPL